jgi:hypothetical protein
MFPDPWIPVPTFRATTSYPHVESWIIPDEDLFCFLKGLSHEMDLDFDVWLVLGLNIGRGHLLNILGASLILYCKKCISRG